MMNANALNAAAWAFVESYQKVLGRPAPGDLFNNTKAVITPAIITYIKELAKSYENTNNQN
jgi:hypothetical protein